MSQSKRKYEWGKGTHKSGSATKFGKLLEKVQVKDSWAAEDVVNAAKNPNNPCHSMFEWDNRVAGNLYRVTQAREYIRSLVVTVVSEAGETKMPVAVSFGSGNGYSSTESVMSSAELRRKLLEQAIHEIEVWKNRYKYLKELSAVFDAVEEVKFRQAG